MNETNSGIRVFVDSNVLISAMQSEKSASRELLLLLCEEHHLMICSYSLTEISGVLAKRFPHKLSEWDQFLSRLEFELVYTPTDPTTFPAPPIRDDKDLPILVSALLAQPDVLVTGDQDFHTPQIKEQLVVLTPSDFLRAFGHEGRHH